MDEDEKLYLQVENAYSMGSDGKKARYLFVAFGKVFPEFMRKYKDEKQPPEAVMRTMKFFDDKVKEIFQKEGGFEELVEVFKDEKVTNQAKVFGIGALEGQEERIMKAIGEELFNKIMSTPMD